VAFARTLRAQAVTSVARAFPCAIDGELDAFHFDPVTRVLDIAMRGAPASGRHVLAAPRLVYTDDIVVTCDGISVPFERAGGRVEVACAGTTLSMRPDP